jgi:hypothetical protein
MDRVIKPKPRRSKKTELVRYIKEPEVKLISPEAAFLAGLAPGQKVLVEMQLREKGDDGLSAYMSVKDGKSGAVFPGILVKINSVDQL